MCSSCHPSSNILQRCVACHASYSTSAHGRVSAPQIVDSIVTVNPSYLSRASSAGTYAKLAIHPMARREVQDAARNEAQLEHRVYERARVDIVRI